MYLLFLIKEIIECVYNNYLLLRLLFDNVIIGGKEKYIMCFK